MAIIDKSNFAYISVTGIAKLYNRDTIVDYELILRRINENYIPTDAAMERVKTVV